MVEKIALKRGHTISAKIEVDTKPISLNEVDVAIDFSTPDAAFENIRTCFEQGIPVVSGTTGWLDRYPEAVQLCKASKTGFIYASNFSLGVNLFFAMNEHVAALMKDIDAYKVEIEEIHHTQKLDAPSGTAISLAEGIIENSDYKSWDALAGDKDQIPVHSKREGSVPGTHTISYSSEVDSIILRHEAHNREGFALGAVVAAEWIIGKSGVFSMRDVLNLG